MPFADPSKMYPLTTADGDPLETTVFLRPAIQHSRMSVGDYTYASAHSAPDDWAFHLAPYLYDFSPERLIIGRFCQIADGVTFITASANHRYDGFSSYPFMIFSGADRATSPSMPAPGPDTIVGHDVWLGQGVRVMPGVRIGNGVIIAAGSVVTADVPDYAIVGGNPARVLRMRFAADTIARLLDIAWWDWDIARIAAHEAAIVGADLPALEAARP